METETETETVRLRLAFEDRHFLSKSQRTEGLKRSWFLLKPQLKTISHLSSYLLYFFNLTNACPNGLILSMNGFVLPPFESTHILKDTDIICVKKKGGKSSEIAKVGDGANELEVEIVEKQPAVVLTDVNLLSNEEFDKETGGYASESEENEHAHEKLEHTEAGCSVSKKRKASNKLQGSKRKKRKNASSEDCLPEDDLHVEKNGTSHRGGVLTEKSLVKKNRSFNTKGKLEESSTPENDDKSSSESKPNAKRQCQLSENGKGGLDVSSTSGGTKKVPSRSARRKKAKRHWLRERLRMEKEELHHDLLLGNDNQQSPEKDSPKFIEEHQFNQNSDVEDDMVPIVVRPGHIRFDPNGKVDADRNVQQNHIPMEIFQWNGITSKKKGQKWGKDKNAASKKNNSTDFYQECPDMLITEEEMTVDDDIDFKKFKPYAGLPKEGDVVAYRLIELSSFWTPELSSFRVGKISSCDPESNKILLVPVPEYPIAFDRNVDKDASELQTDMSLYREDGSLEMDFSSLIDVRIVKHGNLSSAKSVTSAVNEVDERDQTAVTSQPKNNNEVHAPTKENGQLDAWEEISQALSAKKAQLSQEDDWSTKESSGRRSWPYKAFRGSALGPIMSLLRAENGLEE
ncbi:hypothetical protein CFOL_v3_18416 [Cephalotus follicularis]|uniref:Uncharacterized protein n=1 Tax=Cephalotus follicularis TaxID=3775 RepID=A0A1Q3C3V5_CEPFO|nr:hypothetical protein CFOL_v3_18416 [Cephalotus follicularis]